MPNISTQIANDLMQLTSQMPRVEAALVKKLKKQFQSFQADMLAEVARFDVTGVDAMSYREKRALALVDSVSDITKKAYSDFNKGTEAELLSITQTTHDAFISITNGAAEGELLTRTLDSDQLKFLVKNNVVDGAKSSQWWKAQEKNTLFKFQNTIQDSIIKGDPVDVITRKIRGTKALGFNDGFMNTAFNNARSLVQTSVQNVTNSARIETMQANDDVIDGIQWLSTLDGQTTQICKGLDGLAWDLDYKPIGHDKQWPGPTAHWGCRSSQTPFIKAYDKLPPAKRKLLEGTRASIDGQVSESINYDEWLKNKDKTNPKFVKETLGPAKYDIWKTKDLTMADMTDQFNNPLTAEQLAVKFN